MIAMYLRSQGTNLTWQAVIDTLRIQAVGEEALADEIARKYGDSGTKEEAITPPVESTPTCECMTELL